MYLIYSFFDVNNIFFTMLGYPISYLEFVGTIFNLACVILVARRSIWNWPVGIIGVILFGALFYQINLYADMLEQLYYFITGIIGWYIWTTLKSRSQDDTKVIVSRNTKKINLQWLGAIALTSILLTWVLANISTWLPALFPDPASLPALDATTTVMSFVAQYWLIKRKIDSWYLWIIVDIVAIGLYWYKAVPFVAILYVVFLINAIYGLKSWTKHERDSLIKEGQ